MWRPWIVACLWVLPGVAGAAPDDSDLLAPLTPAQRPARPPAHPPRPKKPSAERRASKPAEKGSPAKGSTRSGTLAVSLKEPVEGARVTVDDRILGVLPLPPQELAPGLHVVRIRRLGYAELVHKVTVLPGRPAVLSLRLDPIAGVLRITGPAGTLVEIDGAKVGELPLTERVLVPGPHQVGYTTPGHEARTWPVLLEAGRDVHLDVTALPRIVPSTPPVAVSPPAATSPEFSSVPPEALPPPPSPMPGAPAGEVATGSSDPGFFGRWYVWVGLTVVAAGVATGAWALASNAGAHAPEPGRVCAGTCDVVLNAQVGMPTGAGALGR